MQVFFKIYRENIILKIKKLKIFQENSNNFQENIFEKFKKI